MKIRCKFLMICFVFVAIFLFAPVQVVHAADYDLYNFESYGLNNDSTKITINDVWDFLKGIPDAIVSFFSGFNSIVELLGNLILVVFPFFPPVFVSILLLLLLLYLFIAIYRLIQGWFG